MEISSNLHFVSILMLVYGGEVSGGCIFVKVKGRHLMLPDAFPLRRVLRDDEILSTLYCQSAKFRLWVDLVRNLLEILYCSMYN